MPYVTEPMTLDDLPEVHAVELQSVPTPWPLSAYRRELGNPQGNHYVVCRWRPPGDGAVSPQQPRRGPELRGGGRGLFPLFNRAPEAPPPAPIVGFAGMWTLMDEAHVTIIGVGPGHRSRGVGEFVFTTLIDEATRRNATWVTLEVRVSNSRAQNLYRKYGFSVQATRRRYYSDDGEDAYVMSSPPINTPEFAEDYAALRAANRARMAQYHQSLAGSNDPRTYQTG